MKTLLIGAGGHAKVVFDALVSCDVKLVDISIRAGKRDLQSDHFMGLVVAVPELPEVLKYTKTHVAIGASHVREQLLGAAKERGAEALTVIHPGSHLSRYANLGEGTFVAAGAIVAATATLKDGVIVNHNAVVDHDCSVGSWSHIAPGAVLGGGVYIGRHVLVGAGAVVLPGLSLGDNVVVGAGSVVTKSVAAGCKWIGTAMLPQDTIND